MSEVIEQRAATCDPLGALTCRGAMPSCFTRFCLTMVAAPIVTALELTGALIELLLAANLVAAVMPVRSGASRRALLTLIRSDMGGALL